MLLRIKSMKNPFTEHPNSVNETYFEHLKFAMCFSFNLFVAAIACFIHSIFPFLFKYTAGKRICKIVHCLKETGRWEALEKMVKQSCD